MDDSSAQRESSSHPLRQPLGFFEVDPATGSGSWSRSLCERLGQPSGGGAGDDSSAGHPAFIEAVHPQDRQRTMEELTSPADREGLPIVATRLLAEDGEVHRVVLMAHLMRDASGLPVRLVGVVHDDPGPGAACRELDRVTRRLERLTRVSREVSRTLDTDRILMAIGDVLGEIARPDRMSVGLICPDDPAQQDLLALVGVQFEGSFPAGSRVPVSRFLLPVLEGDSFVRVEFSRSVEMVARRLHDQGLREGYSFGLRVDARLIGFLHLGWMGTPELTPEMLEELAGLAQHVAPALANAMLHRQVQERDAILQQRQKLEAVGQLAAGVAHDFNNILTVIQASGSILQEELDQSALSEDVDAIMRASERASSLTSKLLAFGRQELVTPERLDFDRQIRQVSCLLQRVVENDIVIETVLAGAGAEIFIDPTSLEQVMLNLALNARDAMPQGGMLSLKTTVVSRDAVSLLEHQSAVEGRYACLIVTDTGTGMDAVTRRRIFEPFFSTKGPQGTGLGLSIVYGIVAQCGGFIEVESSEGQGTCFSVHLPCVDDEAETDSGEQRVPRIADPAPDHASRRLSILLVDDERSVREAVERLVVALGHEVRVASNGEQALALCLEDPGRFDVLLSDLVMPGMSGLEVAQRARGLAPDLPIIIMSGHVEPDKLDPLRASGYGMLRKPFFRGDLQRALAAIVG